MVWGSESLGPGAFERAPYFSSFLCWRHLLCLPDFPDSLGRMGGCAKKETPPPMLSVKQASNHGTKEERSGRETCQSTFSNRQHAKERARTLLRQVGLELPRGVVKGFQNETAVFLFLHAMPLFDIVLFLFQFTNIAPRDPNPNCVSFSGAPL